MESTLANISQKSFQPRFYGQCFLKTQRKNVLESIAKYDVILLPRRAKFVKVDWSSAGYRSSKTAFLYQERRIKYIFNRSVIIRPPMLKTLNL